ncbi:hypothetical protein [Bacillus thuringiensis]|uniref:hypothetical protein n=1 Tax=Bacillus thuringiensis TaxID=1428 RepID=UPI0021D64B38|nr:hypothetical protein [Bacillus thuringiensis]MCU7667556.1 hypothetical protein [Bacillus thuringiensis]
MKKFIQSIENAIKAGEKKHPNYSSHTIRQDVVKRALERGAFLKAKCRFSYTDDYAWDNATNCGKGEVSGETIVDKMNFVGADRCSVRKEETQYEISIRIHSNLVYDVYVPLTADSTKNNKKKSGKTSSVTKKNLDNGSKEDTPIEVTITENQEKNGIEIRFSRRPDEHILKMVSDKKFRWSKRGHCWYAKRTEERLSFAKEIKDLFKDTKEDLGLKEEVKKEIPKVVITNNVIDATALFAKRAAV